MQATRVLLRLTAIQCLLVLLHPFTRPMTAYSQSNRAASLPSIPSQLCVRSRLRFQPASLRAFTRSVPPSPYCFINKERPITYPSFSQNLPPRLLHNPTTPLIVHAPANYCPSPSLWVAFARLRLVHTFQFISSGLLRLMSLH